MLSFKEVENKSIALVVWNKEKEDDAHVYLGKITKSGSDLAFVNESKKWHLNLGTEVPDDLCDVESSLKSMLLDADYWFSMYVSDLEEDSTEGLLPTGLKWHE